MSEIYPEIKDDDYIGEGYFTATVRWPIGSLSKGQTLIVEAAERCKPRQMHIIGGITINGMRRFAPSYCPEARYMIFKWRLTNICPRLGSDNK